MNLEDEMNNVDRLSVKEYESIINRGRIQTLTKIKKFTVEKDGQKTMTSMKTIKTTIAKDKSEHQKLQNALKDGLKDGFFKLPKQQGFLQLQNQCLSPDLQEIKPDDFLFQKPKGKVKKEEIFANIAKPKPKPDLQTGKIKVEDISLAKSKSEQVEFTVVMPKEDSKPYGYFKDLFTTIYVRHVDDKSLSGVDAFYHDVMKEFAPDLQIWKENCAKNVDGQTAPETDLFKVELNQTSPTFKWNK